MEVEARVGGCNINRRRGGGAAASGTGRRQVNVDLQAAAVASARTDVAAAGVDDGLGDRETKTVTAAGAIARLREAHERLEYRFDAILRNAGTAVLDLDHAEIGRASCRDRVCQYV